MIYVPSHQTIIGGVCRKNNFRMISHIVQNLNVYTPVDFQRNQRELWFHLPNLTRMINNLKVIF